MPVLFLDPLVLALLVALVIYVGLVWRGRFRRWLGRSAAWTVLAWPLPLLVLVVPVVAGAGLALVRLADAEIGGGAVAAAALYSTMYLVPLAVMSAWPPRWLLPGWARARLTALPGPDATMPPGARPALHARRGHGSAARWIWRVDAVPGFVWLDAGRLCFRAHHDGGANRADLGWELEEATIEGLRFRADDVLVVEAPRGGWWTRDHLDVDLAEVDRCRVRYLRPWRRDGLVSVEVAGRQSVHVWVAEARTLADLLPGDSPTHRPEQQ